LHLLRGRRRSREDQSGGGTSERSSVVRMNRTIDLGGVVEGAGGADAHFEEVREEEAVLEGEEGAKECVPKDESPIFLTIFETASLSVDSPELKTNDGEREDSKEDNQKLVQHRHCFFRPRILII
jgi:hypothetical protein